MASLTTKLSGSRMLVVRFDDTVTAQKFFLDWEFGATRQGGGGEFGKGYQAIWLELGSEEPENLYILQRSRVAGGHEHVTDSIGLY